MGKATVGLGGAAPGASAEPLDGRDDRLISLPGRSPVLDAAQLGILRGYGSEAGDPGLRTALFVAANLARQTDPALAAKYRRLVVERKLHHNSAVCYLAAVLATRIVASLRAGTPIRSADSTDKPSPAPKAESSAKNSACNPTNGPAQGASGKRARRHQRSLSASPPDPPNKPKHHLTAVRNSPLADTRLSDELLPTAFKNGDAMIRVAVGAPGYGLHGFRQTHVQAERTQDLALAAKPGAWVTTFADVGLSR